MIVSNTSRAEAGLITEASLSIKNIPSINAGEYECIGSNAINAINKTVKLIVQCKNLLDFFFPKLRSLMLRLEKSRRIKEFCKKLF